MAVIFMGGYFVFMGFLLHFSQTGVTILWCWSGYTLISFPHLEQITLNGV